MQATSERFSNQSVLITGGASGFGRACAIRLALEGAAVAIVDIDASGVVEVAAEIEGLGRRAIGIQADVTDEASVAKAVGSAVAEFGQLTGAINSAGRAPESSFLLGEYDTRLWDSILGLNLRGLFLSCKYELAHMAKAGSGAIVNVSSIGGLSASSPGFASYNASKHGVIGVTKAAARDYAAQGIRVNALCPGSMVTPMTEGLRVSDPAHWQRMVDRIPLGGFGEPDVVAGAALFLLSSDSAWVTGQALVADGGTLL